MSLDESELSRVARTDTPAKVDGHVVKDDDYDEVIQTQKQEIKDLEARKTELEGKREAQRLAIDGQKENIKTLKEDLIKSRQQKSRPRNPIPHHDNARYIGSGLAVLSGALMIVALVVGSVPLSIGSLVLGVVSARFSAFYETAAQTHWLKSGFGHEHDQHQETPGLENWDDPTICAQGLRSLLCRPIIGMNKDPYWVTITVQSSVLAGYTTPEIELDIKADFNIGNEDEHPWQPLHSPFIANTDAKAVADARIIQQGNQTQYRFDRGLFTEMLENLNKDNRWYKGAFKIDDFLFQVRVRGIMIPSSRICPQRTLIKPLKPMLI